MNIKITKYTASGKKTRGAIYPVKSNEVNQALEQACNIIYMQLIQKYGLIAPYIIDRTSDSITVEFKPAMILFDSVKYQFSKA